MSRNLCAAVYQYALDLTDSELQSALAALGQIVDSGPVPSGLEDDLHPIPGIELIVEIPNEAPPQVPSWILLIILIKIIIILLLVLLLRVLTRCTIESEGGDPEDPPGAELQSFINDAESILGWLARVVRVFDRGAQPGSSDSSESDSDVSSDSSGSDGSSDSDESSDSSESAASDESDESESSIISGGSMSSSSSSSGPNVRNIVLIGMWPESNAAIVDFAESRPQPTNYYPSALWGGWQGDKPPWSDRGFRIYAFFPTFVQRQIWLLPYSASWYGSGQFMVQYDVAAGDFWAVIPPLQPVALIALTRGFTGWKFERETTNHKHTDWKDVWGENSVPPYSPTQPHRPPVGGSDEDPSPYQNTGGPIPDDPPDSTRVAGFVRGSSLGYSGPDAPNGWQVVADVNKAMKAAAFAWEGPNPGAFVSEYIGYLVNWYGQEKVLSPTEEQCPLHGSIHVGTDVDANVARQALKATLESVTKELNRLGFS